MTFKKKDFIEIEFTGKIKDTGEVFDSNIQKDIKNSNSDIPPKPFIFCLGEGMFLKAIDDFLISKKTGNYKLELTPEKAFGKRDAKLIQLMSMRVFKQHNLNPVPGIPFNFDGRMGKILSVSGGRVIVDFNNPIAGKDVSYDIKVLRKVEDLNEKIKAFINFLFRKDLDFEVKEKTIIIKVEKQMAKFVEMFEKKFEDVFDMKLKVEEKEEKKNKLSKGKEKKESKEEDNKKSEENQTTKSQ